MNQIHPAFSEVIDTCAKIEQLLTAPVADAAVHADLLAHFSCTYSMVNIGGEALGYQALANFFTQMAGKKPGLMIAITDLVLLHEDPHIAIVTFTEVQTLFDGTTNRRCSTVIFDKVADGRFLWRHLQETKIV